MKKLILLISVLFITLAQLQAQNRVVLENNRSFTFDKYKKGKQEYQFISEKETKTFKITEVRYFTKKNKRFTLYARNGKLWPMKLSKDLTGNCQIGEIHAYKYFKSEQLMKQNPDISDLMADPEWKKCFDSRTSKIKSGRTVGVIAGSTAFLIGLGSLLATLNQL